MRRIIVLLLPVVLLGCIGAASPSSSPAPSPGDSGTPMASTDAFGSPSPEPVAAHVVDGWRLGPEYPCPASWGTGCADITRAATKLVQAKYPGAGIVQTHLAPPLCGPYLCTNGGLEQPDFVVLDMADGSRRVVVLLCGQTCSASPFTYPESRAQP